MRGPRRVASHRARRADVELRLGVGVDRATGTSPRSPGQASSSALRRALVGATERSVVGAALAADAARPRRRRRGMRLQAADGVRRRPMRSAGRARRSDDPRARTWRSRARARIRSVIGRAIVAERVERSRRLAGRPAALVERPAGWPAPSRSARSMSASARRPRRARSASSDGLEDDALDDRGAATCGDDPRLPRSELRTRPGRGRPSVVAVEARRRTCGRGDPPRRAAPGWATAAGAAAGRALPHAAGRGEVDVDADEVHELERAHREPGVANRRRRSPRPTASPPLEQPQRLDRERPVDAVDDEPGRVAQRTGVLPHALDEPSAARRRRPRVAGPATTSTRGITGAGLKKWSPRTRSGRGRGTAMAVDRERARVRRQDRVGRRRRVERPEDRVASGRGPRARPRSTSRPPRASVALARWPSRPARRPRPIVDRVGVELELAARRARPSRMPAAARARSRPDRRRESRPPAGLERDLGDAGTHRPAPTIRRSPASSAEARV